MLRYRVITGLVLAPLAIGAVFYLDTLAFAVVFWCVAAAAVYEWAGLLGLQHVAARVAYVSAYGLCAVALWYLPAWHVPLMLAGVIVWLCACVAVLTYPRLKDLYANAALLAPLGLFIGSVGWVALVGIRQVEQGSWWLLFMFGVVWGADVGAYFAGRAFGKRPLAPHVSPAKTWEGVAGGALLPGIICGAAVMLWQPQPLFWLGVTLLLVGVSVFGDLFESLLKRATGIKDSGTLLPGHGGMLDRIDSILAVLPVLAVILV